MSHDPLSDPWSDPLTAPAQDPEPDAPDAPDAPAPDATSQRLYTQDEFEAYAREREASPAPAVPPVSAHGSPAPQAPVVAPPPAPVNELPPRPGAQDRRAEVRADPDPGPVHPPEESWLEQSLRTQPAEVEVPRFMSASDFLDRRAEDQPLGPANWGWRGRLRRWSGGLIRPRMGRAELAHERDRRAIQRDLDGPRTIVFLNPKGGAAKTTGVLMAGHTFGTVRGGGVVAWDNNETRGTLGIRATRGEHRNTTRELLEDLGRFDDVHASRIGDLGAFVRSQGNAHFDVLASDERADVTGMIRAEDFRAVHALLQRFYRVVLIDTGNNLRAENWLAAAGAADLLVVTSTVREDTGYSGLWMLDALTDAGHTDLARKAITVLSDPSPKVDEKLATDLVEVYEQRTRAVFRVPYDPALVSGSVVPYGALSEATRRSWLAACAAMVGAL